MISDYMDPGLSDPLFPQELKVLVHTLTLSARLGQSKTESVWSNITALICAEVFIVLFFSSKVQQQKCIILYT